MERIRAFVCGFLLVLGVLFCPSVAYASDGFLGGLQDLTGTRDLEQQSGGYEERYLEGYEPELREVETAPSRALPEDATTVDYVNSTVDEFNSIRWGGSNSTPVTLLGSLRNFWGAGSNSYSLAMREILVITPIGLVFMWWGVRKVKNMIMNGFRKGRITT